MTSIASAWRARFREGSRKAPRREAGCTGRHAGAFADSAWLICFSPRSSPPENWFSSLPVRGLEKLREGSEKRF